MATIYLLNKPFQVLSQFSDTQGRSTLADFVPVPKVYPAGRLDYDSEGLLILTGDGPLQARIAEPKFKLSKSYWAQVEGEITDIAINALKKGVQLNDGPTKPAQVRKIAAPKVWHRNPPIRKRDNQPTSWIELTISEGRNRQVRRMTAEVGFPTLRLIRHRIGPWSLQSLLPGDYREEDVHTPTHKPTSRHQTKPRSSSRIKPRTIDKKRRP